MFCFELFCLLVFVTLRNCLALVHKIIFGFNLFDKDLFSLSAMKCCCIGMETLMTTVHNHVHCSNWRGNIALS